MPKIVDLTGKRFGRLIALKDSGERDSNGSIRYDCICDCGKNKIISGSHLKRGYVLSCGCLSREVHSKNIKKLEADGVLPEKLGMVENTCVAHLKKIKPNKNNKLGIRGVYFNKEKGKYISEIIFKGAKYRLGYFNTKEAAKQAYEKARKEMHENFIKWYDENYIKEAK